MSIEIQASFEQIFFAYLKWPNILQSFNAFIQPVDHLVVLESPPEFLVYRCLPVADVVVTFCWL